MFSIIRKFEILRPLMSLVNTCVVGGSTNSNAGSGHFSRLISTTDEMKYLKQMTKINDKIGGLSTDLVIDQKMKKSSRALSTLQNHAIPVAARVTVSKDESRDFMAVFPDLVRDLTEFVKKYKCYDAAHWLAKAFQYNVPGGKKNRGLLTILTYKNLVNNEQLTPENIRLAQYLGWCVEMLHSASLITDDIIDNSSKRRGQTCWHKLDDVGLISTNDAIMIEGAIYMLLRKHFRHLDCYIDLMELFHETSFVLDCGQSMDLLMSRKDLTSFTMDAFNSVATNKTAYCAFYLPFASAMFLAGVKDTEVIRQSKTILLEMGRFFQVQDDFLDCFGNPDVIGKIGTDIQDRKCSWLAVVCMQRANEEQKAIMMECYGKDDPTKIQRVKDLYKELGIPSTFATYEKESYNMIKVHIQQTSRGVPHKAFLDILDKIFQRNA